MTDYCEDDAGLWKAPIGKHICVIHLAYQYTAEGLWISAAGGARVVRVGFADDFCLRYGKVDFIELPQQGTLLAAGEKLATLETDRKLDYTFASPLSGVVRSVNEQLKTTPRIIHTDPYGSGWLCEIEPQNWKNESAHLLTAEVYKVLLLEGKLYG